MGEHDALFKRFFEDPARAAGELRAVLPASVCDAIDMESLHLVSESFVDDALGDRHADLVFHGSLRNGEPIYVCFLFEHQSEPHPRMPWRILRYVDRIWERHERENPTAKLPLVIPLVVHHGEHGWTAPRQLHELVGGMDAHPELRRFVPSFDFLLDDLIDRTDEELAARSFDDVARVTLWLLRDARDAERFFAHLDAWLDRLAPLFDSEAPPDEGFTFLCYLHDTLGSQHFETVKERVIRHAPRREHAMSLGDSFRREGLEKGRKEGLEKGLEKGKRDTLRRLLELKFGPLDATTITRVEQAPLGELDVFLERLLPASRVEDVTG